MSLIANVLSYPIINSTIGVQWPIDETKPNIPDPEPLFDIFVDSVNGNDSNNGLTEATAKKTISAIPLTDGIKIGIKRGSYFRETLNTGANVIVDVYGTGKLPVFDCADVFTGTWTQPSVEDFPNAWQATFTTQDSAWGLYPALWRNGVRLKWDYSINNVNATPDTYYVATPNSETRTLTFTIHSITNPNTDGVLYEMTSREIGLGIGKDSIARYIRTKRNLHNNGSTAIGENGLAEHCIFEDGTKHNVYVGRNGKINGCIMYKSDWPIRDNHSFHVGHALNGSGAKNTIENSIIYGEREKIRWAAQNGAAIGGIQYHTSGTDGENWQETIAVGNYIKFCNVGLSGADSDQTTTGRNKIEGCYQPFVVVGGEIISDDDYILESDTVQINRAVMIGGTGNATFNGLRLWFTMSNDAAIYDYSTANKLTVNNGVIYRENGGDGYAYFIRQTNANRTFDFKKNIFYAPQAPGEVAVIASQNVANSTASQNYYAGSPNVDFELNGSNFFNYSSAASGTFSAIFTGSVQGTDKGVKDAANGDFTNTTTNPANSMGVGIVNNVEYLTLLTYEEIDAL